jgi:hypothetical protein
MQPDSQRRPCVSWRWDGIGWLNDECNVAKAAIQEAHATRTTRGIHRGGGCSGGGGSRSMRPDASFCDAQSNGCRAEQCSSHGVVRARACHTYTRIEANRRCSEDMRVRVEVGGDALAFEQLGTAGDMHALPKKYASCVSCTSRDACMRWHHPRALKDVDKVVWVLLLPPVHPAEHWVGEVHSDVNHPNSTTATASRIFNARRCSARRGCCCLWVSVGSSCRAILAFGGGGGGGGGICG